MGATTRRRKPSGCCPASTSRNNLFSTVVATLGDTILEPNIKELPVVKVEFDEVKELADLTGLHTDLTSVVEMTRRLYDVLCQDEQNRDSLIVKSLWTSALIT